MQTGYEDNFDRNRLGDYTAYDLGGNVGVWSVAGGVLTGSGRALHNVLIRNGSNIADGYVEAKLNRADDAGLVFRFQNAGSYYLLGLRDDAASLPDFHSQNVALYRAVDGRFELMFERDVAWPRGGKLARVEFRGDSFSIYFDGQLLGVAREPTPGFFRTGAVGVRHMLHPRASTSINVFDLFRAGTL